MRRYLEAENAAGTARLDDSVMAATQFLGMISNYVFWPRMLLLNWNPKAADTQNAVKEAVLTMLSRYGVANGDWSRLGPVWRIMLRQGPVGCPHVFCTGCWLRPASDTRRRQ